LKKRLKRWFVVREAVCPILVLSKSDPTFTRDSSWKHSEFLDVIEWKAVFDFGFGSSEHSLYRYINDHLGKIGITTSFEVFDVCKKQNNSELESTKRDICASTQMTWFFASNSHVVSDKPAYVVSLEEEVWRGIQ
jgi:hypothetical protein